MVVFLGSECWSGECDPAAWGGYGRIQNTGDSTAYRVLVVTRPCGTCSSTGSIQVLDSLAPGAQYRFRAIRGFPPGSQPVLEPLERITTPPDSTDARNLHGIPHRPLASHCMELPAGVR
jgi:hypothetical protein